jgi:hypothetical protein
MCKQAIVVVVLSATLGIRMNSKIIFTPITIKFKRKLIIKKALGRQLFYFWNIVEKTSI